MDNKKEGAKKINEEVERRKAVVFEKMLGKQIETIEKSRISPDIISIKDRILCLMESMDNHTVVAKTNLPKINRFYKFDIQQTQIYKLFYDSYKSIREDIIQTIAKKEGAFKQKFDKIFPEIPLIDIKTWGGCINFHACNW